MIITVNRRLLISKISVRILIKVSKKSYDLQLYKWLIRNREKLSRMKLSSEK